MPPPPSRDPYAVELERVPWSVLGPDFIATWGRTEPKNPQPEHAEVIGQNGSGKTFLLGQINAEMVRRRNSSIVYVATKEADKSITDMGWDIVDTWREVQQRDQCIFWPQTSKKGQARKAYHALRISELLDNLWSPAANTIVEFDEFAYVESLSRDVRDTLQMYLREGRSHGITVVAGKQRVQGVQRDMHSETRVTFAFKVKDLDDQKRLAEVLGNRRGLLPVIEGLSLERHEFIVKHDVSDTMFISWVDKPVDLKRVAQTQSGYRK